MMIMMNKNHLRQNGMLLLEKWYVNVYVLQEKYGYRMQTSI